VQPDYYLNKPHLLQEKGVLHCKRRVDLGATLLPGTPLRLEQSLVVLASNIQFALCGAHTSQQERQGTWDARLVACQPSHGTCQMLPAALTCRLSKLAAATTAWMRRGDSSFTT
jgi:hypothetical protein